MLDNVDGNYSAQYQRIAKMPSDATTACSCKRLKKAKPPRTSTSKASHCLPTVSILVKKNKEKPRVGNTSNPSMLTFHTQQLGIYIQVTQSSHILISQLHIIHKIIHAMQMITVLYSLEGIKKKSKYISYRGKALPNIFNIRWVESRDRILAYEGPTATDRRGEGSAGW